jgi:hypothetical protein
MPNNTMTLAFEGDVPFDLFDRAMHHFRGLIAGLTNELSPSAEIEWFVEDASGAGAALTVRGEAADPDAVEPIPDAFLAIGKALAERRPIPYSPEVAKEALDLSGVIDGKVSAIRFETVRDDVVVRTAAGEPSVPPTGAWGAIDGRVQAPSGRSPLRFTLHDAVSGRPVACYLREGQEELVRGAWDRRAIVEGWITRAAQTGQPLTIRKIRRVTLLDDVVPGTLLRAVRGSDRGSGASRARQGGPRVKAG